MLKVSQRLGAQPALVTQYCVWKPPSKILATPLHVCVCVRVCVCVYVCVVCVCVVCVGV